jgi:ribonuclease Y
VIDSPLLAFITGVVVGGGSIALRALFKKRALSTLTNTIIHEAELRAKEITMKAKQQAEASSFALEMHAQKKFLQEEKQLLVQKEQLKSREERFERERKILEQKLAAVSHSEKLAQQMKSNAERGLESLAQMTRKGAEQALLLQGEEKIRRSLDSFAAHAIRRAREACELEAKKIMITALGRSLGRVTHDAGIDIVTIADSEFKGRIIGREGRNKKAFEDATGVTLVIDQNAKTIILSSFDPLRRHIAKETLQSLMQSQKVYPEAIDELVKEKTKSVRNDLVRIGREAAQEARVAGLHPEILRLLGQLRFRLSLGQNVLLHSLEVSSLMEALASELCIDTVKAARMGLLHDIGKALPLDAGESHALAGARFLREHGEEDVICNGVACHHDEVEPLTMEAGLVKIADALSAAKAGSRDSKKEQHFVRLRNLEQLASQEAGVSRAYALESGKEVQVYVEPSRIDDSGAKLLAEKLFIKLNDGAGLPYPIKVSVIREQKMTESCR